MKKIDKNSPLYDRRIILIDEKIKTNVKWGKLTKDIFSGGLSIIGPIITISKYLYDSDTYKNSEIGFGEISYCNNHFKFPPQHPQKGIVYTCADYQSDFYIPFSNFHKYALDLKTSAFTEMCAHLGAKEIILIENTENGKKAETDINIENIPSQNGTVSGGIKGGYYNKENKKIKTSFTFPKPEHQNILPYENKWLDSEPTWKTLQKVRLENKVLEYTAELNYTDEMGVNATISGILNKMGLNIGGNFEQITKVERKYKVIFW